MSGRTFRLARESDRENVVNFVNIHWDTRHPLVNVAALFDYYYKADGGALRFALAEEGGAISALVGFVPASMAKRPDVWVSLWAADKAARGAGLELMAELPALTGCRTLACNNIRENTLPFYEFLGYKTGRVEQFYRLSPRESYRLARIVRADILPVAGAAVLREVKTPEALEQVAEAVLTPARVALMNPLKDAWYLRRRYFEFPHLEKNFDYRLYSAEENGDPFAVFAMRVAGWQGARALRVVDYIGLPADLPRAGSALDALLRETGADYADFYCAGIDETVMSAAGFTLRRKNDDNIIPNYLDPPLFENTDYYYFTSNPEGFTMFRADGDQDRPNISV